MDEGTVVLSRVLKGYRRDDAGVHDRARAFDAACLLTPMSEWTRRAVLGAGVAGLAGTLAGCARPSGGVVDGWPLWRRDPGRTGYNPEGPGATGATMVWSSRLGEAGGPPIVMNAGLYLTGESVTAIDRFTGRTRWRHPLFFATREAPAVTAGRVYAIGRSSLLSLGTREGHRHWFETNDIWRYHAPTVANGRLYLGMTKVKFSTSFDARVVAVSLDGSDEWMAPVGSNTLPPFSVAVEGQRVFTGRDRVVALDARTGDRLWTFDDPSISAFADPVVADGTVYVSATRPTAGVPAGTLFALDAADGSEHWRYETGLSPTPPAVTPDGLYLTAEQVTALGRDGAQRWSYGGNQFVTASPSVGADTVFLAGIDGRVVALDAATGQRQWQTATPGALLHAPAVIGDWLYVSSADGYLIAFGPTDSS